MALDRLLRTKRPVPSSSCSRTSGTPSRSPRIRRTAARLFERYDLVSAPVVDESNRLVGVITFDDIVDVIEEEAEEDIKALGGVQREEELSDPVWVIARGRFNWLLVNLATAFLRPRCSGCSRASCKRWWRWRCWRRSWRARAAMPRRRP